MNNYSAPNFVEASVDQVVAMAADFKEKGYAFVQMCASTLEDSVELLYTFQDPTYGVKALQGVRVNVPDGQSCPSITGSYPAAFVFENETHDLFGVNITGINIDFAGEFYTVDVAYPMNPRAAEAPAAAEEEVAGNE